MEKREKFTTTLRKDLTRRLKMLAADFINPPFWVSAIGRFECEECGSFANTSVAQTIIAKSSDQERIAISQKPKEAAPGTYLEISGEKNKGVEGLRYIFKKIEVYCTSI